MPDVASVNGVLSTADEARVPVLDRGFLYGDGVYETVRTYAGRPFRLAAHLERLQHSAEALGIDLSRLRTDPFRAVHAALERGGFPESAIRIVLTRGTGGIGYDDAGCSPPTLVVHVRACPEIPAAWRAEGVDVAVVDVQRNAVAAVDPAIKSSNLLNNLLAWRAGRRLGVFEPILLNAEGRLAEGASSNLFVAAGGRLRTPALAEGILRGITREAVIALAGEASIPVDEEPLPPEALRRADEAFLTSTLKGVLPIRRVDGWPLGDGRPGPLTQRLMQDYEALTAAETKADSPSGESRR
jgi:branched-chain amino acid aminotransferase